MPSFLSCLRCNGCSLLLGMSRMSIQSYVAISLRGREGLYYLSPPRPALLPCDRLVPASVTLGKGSSSELQIKTALLLLHLLPHCYIHGYITSTLCRTASTSQRSFLNACSEDGRFSSPLTLRLQINMHERILLLQFRYKSFRAAALALADSPISRINNCRLLCRLFLLYLNATSALALEHQHTQHSSLSSKSSPRLCAYSTPSF